MLNHDSGAERHYLRELKRKLSTLPVAQRAPLLDPKDVDFIIEAARVPSLPLLEMANVLMIHRAWARGRSLIDLAQIMIDTRGPRDDFGSVSPNEAQRRILSHYASDLRAQIRGREIYAGIDTFINMSGSSPRNLLVILKNVYRWALFNGERPFDGGKISIEAQQSGIQEAAKWFFDDAKPLGQDGEDVHTAIDNLGELFRRMRFADKLVECSLTTFSSDLSGCSSRTREMVELARRWGMLVRVDEGQKERNTGLIEAKFQLNRMLSPRWNLPIARRGAVRLSSNEMNAIFDPTHFNEFRSVVRGRLRRMNAPFGRGPDSTQETLRLDV
jgi:hypothetical protein